MSAPRLHDSAPNNEPLSVSQLIKRYLQSLEGRLVRKEITEDHLINCRRALQSFLGSCGDKLVEECRQYDLTQWLRSNPGWKSVNTQRRNINAVLGMMNWGSDDEEEGLIDRNPYRKPKSLRLTPEKFRRPALESEYIALIRNGSVQLKQALFFLWHSGARTSEMRCLRWVHIFWGENPHIRLEQHKTRKKTGQARIISLSPMLVKFLRYLDRTSLTDHVFVNMEGKPWTRHSFCKNLRRTAKRIGLDRAEDRVSAYCLRHSFACMAIESGQTSKQVADLLGHRDSKMVERVYASHTSQHLDYLTKLAAEVERKRRG